MTDQPLPADKPLDGPDALGRVLSDLQVDFVRDGTEAFLVTLPGERRHRTPVWLTLGRHELLIESFVCRAPDENAEEVYRYLLRRNALLRSMAYMVDQDGDIHLVGRVGRSAATPTEIDLILGNVLAASDADFNPLLERGFATAIRREWQWRNATGQSVGNLTAFRRLIASGQAGR